MSTQILILFLINSSQIKPVTSIATEVSPNLVCEVQHAIRFQESEWSPELCQELATAYNKEGESQKIKGLPVIGFAISINESDLRAKVTSEPFKRIILTKKKKLPKEVKVVDVGLMGVRCLKGEKGHCINDPVSGMTVSNLLNPIKNIEVGMKILKSKYEMHGKDWLMKYNGGSTESHGYAGKINAILFALNGIQLKVSGKRMKKLTGQIVEAVTRGVVASR